MLFVLEYRRLVFILQLLSHLKYFEIFLQERVLKNLNK